jgi:hypothetical protein
MSFLNTKDSMSDIILNQGKQFLNIQKDYKYLVDPHLSLIEETSSPNLGSIIENFSNDMTDKLSALAAEKKPPAPAFALLINQYNKLLGQYQNATESSMLVSNNAADQAKNASNIEAASALNDQLLSLLTQMDKMVTSQLINKTYGVPGQSSPYAAGGKGGGSGQEGVGDRPALLAARKALNAQGSALMQQRAAYDEQVNILDTLIGEDSDNKVRTRSAYYQFLVWSIVSVTLVGYTVKFMLGRR